MYVQGWLTSLFFYAILGLFAPRLLGGQWCVGRGWLLLGMAGLLFGTLSLCCPYMFWAAVYSHLACLCFWGAFSAYSHTKNKR